MRTVFASDEERKAAARLSNHGYKERNPTGYAAKLARAADLRRTDGYGPNKHLRERYGITLARKTALFVAQGSKCLVCHSGEPKGGGWAVDHDHSCCAGVKSCGKCIRGILCRSCNCMLGMARDEPAVLRRAAEYLEESWQAKVGTSNLPTQRL